MASNKEEQTTKYSLRAMKRIQTNQNSGKKAGNQLSQSMMALPSESKQPKALVSKLNHLMKDTKNSAIRKADQQKLMTIDEGFYSPSKNSTGKKKASSKKNKSPVKGVRVDKTPTKEDFINESSNIQIHGKFELDVEPEDSKNEYTLEGIAGMVHIKKDVSEENFYSLPMQQPSPLHEFEVDDKTMPENVDNYNFQIDSLELDEFCRNPNLVEIEASQRSHHEFENPRIRFDAEIMSIIGNINKKN